MCDWPEYDADGCPDLNTPSTSPGLDWVAVIAGVVFLIVLVVAGSIYRAG